MKGLNKQENTRALTLKIVSKENKITLDPITKKAYKLEMQSNIRTGPGCSKLIQD